MTNTIMIIGAALAMLAAFHPRAINAPFWRATVTPLASIIGSGFLLGAPILAHIAGHWAFAAMGLLCLIGFVFGAVIRHNIAHLEPLLAGRPPRDIAALERICEYALALAYFISVAYYINLFAAFALRTQAVSDPQAIRLTAMTMIAVLGIIGVSRGLRGLEYVEVIAVGIKLSLIFGLVAALGFAAVAALHHETFALPAVEPRMDVGAARVFLGLVILVQGFETSRFLGGAYDRATRIRTMWHAQLLSTVIYVIFILLATPYFPDTLPERVSETQIIDILSPVAGMVAPLLIFVALTSQLSAAVADMNGAGGLLENASHGRLSVKAGYFITACIAIAVTWGADIFEIVDDASKAFVLYYGLQSVIALRIAMNMNTPRKRFHLALFSGAIVMAFAVLLFSLPLETS